MCLHYLFIFENSFNFIDRIWFAYIASLVVSTENSHLSQSDWETKTGSYQSLPQWIGKNCTDGTGKTGILDFGKYIDH